MENATKALIIAASVLIVIVLIAVGIKILSSVTGVVDDVEKVSSSLGAAVFNSQFTDYDEEKSGVQTGTQVKAFLNKVIATYRDDSSRQIKVLYKYQWHDTAEEIEENVVKKILITDKYCISLDYDDEGYVNRCNIYQAST